MRIFGPYIRDVKTKIFVIEDVYVWFCCCCFLLLVVTPTIENKKYSNKSMNLLLLFLQFLCGGLCLTINAKVKTQTNTLDVRWILMFILFKIKKLFTWYNACNIIIIDSKNN